MGTEEIHCAVIVRLYTDEKFFGPGVTRLLRTVDQTGSLNSAAKRMHMAYSKAWRLIRNANNALGFQLLESRTGGVRGGGAELTPECRAFLESFEQFSAKVQAYAQDTFAELIPHAIACGRMQRATPRQADGCDDDLAPID